MALFTQASIALPLTTVTFISGLILGIIAVFRPTAVQYIALPYSLCQGFTLGVISAVAELKYPGIAIPVTVLTISTAAGMLFLYRSRIIQVTDSIKAIILSATAGLALTYVIIWMLQIFSIIPRTFIDSTSSASIIFSLFAVAIAASNLLLDFALIEESVERRLPRYMEWYGAFTVIVTLIWLYLEILRLAQKLAKKRES